MNGNLTAMLISLVLYIIALGVASAKKINLKFLVIVFVLAAFWFGWQWHTWLGILSVLGGIIVGIIILRAVVGTKRGS